MNEINKYLNIIGSKLQLSKEKFEELNKNYKAISSYIANKHALAGDEEYSIYQQGSFAIDTAIKPLKGDEFDVDVVVEFDIKKGDVGPIEFYNQLYKTFKEGRYGNIVEEYRNNIRINYDNNYHFDIMPAIPLAYNSQSLNVPDRKKCEWVIRSPKLYRSWFLEQANKISKYNKGIKVSIKDNNQFVLERDIAPLAKPKDYELKPTLNRVVQLIKRARDVYFYHEEEYVPQSIVLTTLAAQFYQGEQSIVDALLNIAKKMFELGNNNPRFDVYNPACPNKQENFTQKWKYKIKYYDNYFKFTEWFLNEIKGLLNNFTAKESLNNLFGESLFKNVYEETKYDYFWKKLESNIHKENVFPNAPVKVEKKERGNA